MTDINVAYLFEEPGLFDEGRPIQQELMPTAWITCRVCGIRSKVTVDNAALLCQPCRVDPEMTRSHVEDTLRLAEARWQAEVELFDLQAEDPAVAEAWAKILAARLDADPALFAEAWRRRKAAGGPLGALLEAKEALDTLSDELQRRRAWASAALMEIDVYAAARTQRGAGETQKEISE